MSKYFDNLFIFEMANNHQGSVEHGMRIIDAMGGIVAKHQIKAAVKFQYRQLETFIHPDHIDNKENRHIARFLGTKLTHAQFLSMVNAVKERGMLAVVTPFDEESVPVILQHDVDIIKVASASINDWPLLEKIASAGKPVIASTGGATLQEIDNVVSFFSNRHVDFAILHCVSIYPTPPEDLQLHLIHRLSERYPQITIGYSGHEDPDNPDVAKVAVAMGARILERHVGVPTDTITLNKYSMTPEQTDAWIQGALAARTMIGTDKQKNIPVDERTSLLNLQRGVFAKRAIKKGQTIKAEDVFFAMPCTAGQLTSGQFGKYRANWVASKDYAEREAIFETQTEEDLITEIRAIIHEAKGMLAEARIALGEEYEIELSHHYGMEHFRETGALIISLVNREYCKKLIVMLPNQKHPNHRHKSKEETFQILWGDLELTVEGTPHQLQPGDMHLVARGNWHSFTTQTGVIFEEISTTHIKGDSEYEDEHIAKLDLIKRKTRLEEW